MEQRLIPTDVGQYEPGQWSGKNESGYIPVGDYVLVRPDKAATKSEGGVYFDEDLMQRMTYAAETGVIVAVGQNAFAWLSDRSRRWEGDDKPEPGDRVLFERYGGGIIKGADGEMYRCMQDKSVAAKCQEKAKIV